MICGRCASAADWVPAQLLYDHAPPGFIAEQRIEGHALCIGDHSCTCQHRVVVPVEKITEENADGDRQIIHDDSGEVAAAYCGQPLDVQGRAAMLDLVAAVRRRMEAEDPDGTLGARQAAATARIRNRARKLAEEEHADG